MGVEMENTAIGESGERGLGGIFTEDTVSKIIWSSMFLFFWGGCFAFSETHSS